MSATRQFVHPVRVSFGDCDPAGIVFYPNFLRWFDAATHEMFGSVGLHAAQIVRDTGLIAWPLIDTRASFRSPARYGETIEVHSSISEWRTKTLHIEHRILRGSTLLVEGWEVRFVGEHPADDPERLRAVAIPDWMRQAFD